MFNAIWDKTFWIGGYGGHIDPGLFKDARLARVATFDGREPPPMEIEDFYLRGWWRTVAVYTYYDEFCGPGCSYLDDDEAEPGEVQPRGYSTSWWRCSYEVVQVFHGDVENALKLLDSSDKGLMADERAEWRRVRESMLGGCADGKCKLP